MNIGTLTFETFLEKSAEFHGENTPGVVIGGYMVALAQSLLPERGEYAALVETPKGLADAVQLLTPCTVGNGGLKVVNLGKYALSLYDRETGEGVRVRIDTDRLEAWEEIRGWLFQTTEASRRDRDALLLEICRAGTSVLGSETVRVEERFLKKSPIASVSICAVCKEAYPGADGGICRGCRRDTPYASVTSPREDTASGPSLTAVAVEDAVGRKALHDMTRIEPGVSKGPEFTSGQEFSAGDICRLQKMGRNTIFVEDGDDPDWVHENDAVKGFAAGLAGEGITFDDNPEEGKITFTADRDGLFVLDSERLETFNLYPDVMCATRHNHTVVEKGRPVGGSRAIPLHISRERYEGAMGALEEGPVFRILPMRKARVGILVTGTEVFKGLIKDRFIPIVRGKVEKLGCTVVKTAVTPDDTAMITKSVNELMDAGADLVVTTAGLSVDPDDVTRAGLVDAGLTDAVYGAPLLPGTMTLLGRIGSVQVMGVPACALFFKTTSFDLLLPRLLAGLSIRKIDLAAMGEGGFCLNCRSCTYPKCPFGK